MSHSIVGGSGHSMWSNCPGSALQQAECGLEDEDSFPAREGSCAHQLGENCLSNGVDPNAYLGHLLYQDIPVDQEMVDHIRGYVAFCRTLPGQVFIEWVFNLPEVHRLFFGTLDYAAIDYPNRILRICDLKYGLVEVPAEGCGQLWYYALAIILALGLQDKIDHVVICIYQPRLWNREEPLDHVIVPIADILAWQPSLVAQMNAATNPDALRVPGNWCRYCRGKLTCPEFLGQIGQLQGPFPMAPAHTVQVLDLEKPFVQLFSDAKLDAIRRLNSGQTLPGMKAVRKVGKRQVGNDEDAIAAAAQAAGIPVPQLYERKMKGLTAMEKIPGMKVVLERIVLKPTYGIKAVPIDSKLPEVAVGFSAP